MSDSLTQYLERKYRIARSITPDGEPVYVLYEDLFMQTPFGPAAKANKLAENRDRNVLERAITFLEVGE